MKTLDKAAAWLLLLMGMIHAAMTFRIYKTFDLNVAWFFATAIAIWLTAALNLLRISYGGSVPALRWVAMIANLLLLALDVAIATVVPLRSNPQVSVLGILLALGIAFSLRAPRTTSAGRL